MNSTQPIRFRPTERGFSVIELLIIVVIIGILGTLVAMTYSGVQAQNRNDERQNNIEDIQEELEVYYAQYSKYPTLANLNDTAWLKTNLKDLNPDRLRDPSWSTSASACTSGNASVLIATSTEHCYAYQTSTTEGAACDNVKLDCAQYTLTAVLEGGDKFVKSSLN